MHEVWDSVNVSFADIKWCGACLIKICSVRLSFSAIHSYPDQTGPTHPPPTQCTQSKRTISLGLSITIIPLCQSTTLALHWSPLSVVVVAPDDDDDADAPSDLPLILRDVCRSVVVGCLGWKSAPTQTTPTTIHGSVILCTRVSARRTSSTVMRMGGISIALLKDQGRRTTINTSVCKEAAHHVHS